MPTRQDRVPSWPSPHRGPSHRRGRERALHAGPGSAAIAPMGNACEHCHLGPVSPHKAQQPEAGCPAAGFFFAPPARATSVLPHPNPPRGSRSRRRGGVRVIEYEKSARLNINRPPESHSGAPSVSEPGRTFDSRLRTSHKSWSDFVLWNKRSVTGRERSNCLRVAARGDSGAVSSSIPAQSLPGTEKVNEKGLPQPVVTTSLKCRGDVNADQEVQRRADEEVQRS
jgi:hypothetical protein